MSYVLNKMAQDKFDSILSGDFSSDELDACMCGGKGPGEGLGDGMPKIIPVGGPGKPGIPGMPGMPEGPMGEEVIEIKLGQEENPMSAEATEKTAGMFWCKEASKAVIDNLLRDVVGMNKSQCCDTGRKLEKDQIPDGGHDGEKAATLKPEQTPDDAASIKTDMVAKSHGAVKKEAGSVKGPGVPDGTGPHGGTKKCQVKEGEKEASLEDIKRKKEEDEKKKDKKKLDELAKAQKAKKSVKASEEEGEKAEQDAEDKEEKAKDLLEQAEKDEKKAEEAEGEKDATVEPASPAVEPASPAVEPNCSMFDGIELMASMDEVELNASEAAELSKLFE
jgi:hypothetical protein